MREVRDRREEGVALFKLGQVAEALDDLDHAEALYREGLAIVTEVRDRPTIAGAQHELGRFLIEHGRDRDGGCAMLHDAIQQYAAMGLPQERSAGETARRLGCEDPRP